MVDNLSQSQIKFAIKAAIFGAGCWAGQYEPGLDGMACSISG